MFRETLAFWLGAGLVSAVSGIWIAVSYWNSTRLDYQKSFNERQLDVILSTAQTVGELAGAWNEEEWNKAKARFWELYWGRLVLFEDDKVIKSMVALGDALKSVAFTDRETLQSESYSVSRALQNFLKTKNETDWKISIGTTLDKLSLLTKVTQD
jgi:hypothetical protein